jgi:hypothetical protein
MPGASNLPVFLWTANVELEQSSDSAEERKSSLDPVHYQSRWKTRDDLMVRPSLLKPRFHGSRRAMCEEGVLRSMCLRSGAKKLPMWQ